VSEGAENSWDELLEEKNLRERREGGRCAEGGGLACKKTGPVKKRRTVNKGCYQRGGRFERGKGRHSNQRGGDHLLGPGEATAPEKLCVMKGVFVQEEGRIPREKRVPATADNPPVNHGVGKSPSDERKGKRMDLKERGRRAVISFKGGSL